MSYLDFNHKPDKEGLLAHRPQAETLEYYEGDTREDTTLIQTTVVLP